jgi:putative ABC transport system permease protein
MPEWKPEILRRLAPLNLAPTREADITDELSQHLEDRYQELLASGESEDAAFRTALDELKGEDLLARDLKRIERDFYREPIALGKVSDNVLEGIVQDGRYALRMLRKSPGFTAVAILTLALGIGANTAIFSMVNGIILRTLSYRQPQQLYAINENEPQLTAQSPWGPFFPVNSANFLLWQDHCPAIWSMSLIEAVTFNMTGHGIPRQVNAARVSADFFPLMGIRPQLGRAFLPQEDQLGQDHEVILSDRFWREAFNSNPQIIGRSVTLDNTAYAVVGITPESFRFPQIPDLGDIAPDLFKPVGLAEWEKMWAGLGGHNFQVIARLKPGASPSQALAQLNVIEAGIAQRGDAHRGIAPGQFELKATLRPLKTVILGQAQSALWMLMIAAAFVLLINMCEPREFNARQKHREDARSCRPFRAWCIETASGKSIFR